MTDSDRPKLGKLEGATLQLEAAILLMLMQFRPEPIHTLIWASRTVLRDLHKAVPNKVFSDLDEAVIRRVKPAYLADWRRQERRAANFLKHADKDPNSVLEGVDLDAINQIELIVCILALGSIGGNISKKLTIGLTYAGFLSGGWFDFRGYCEEASGTSIDFEHYSQMPEIDRRKLMLGAFNHVHDPNELPISGSD